MSTTFQRQNISQSQRILVPVIGGICTVVAALASLRSTNPWVSVLTVISGLATIWAAVFSVLNISPYRGALKLFRFAARRERNIELGVFGGLFLSSDSEPILRNRPFRMRPLIPVASSRPNVRYRATVPLSPPAHTSHPDPSQLEEPTNSGRPTTPLVTPVATEYHAVAAASQPGTSEASVEASTTSTSSVPGAKMSRLEAELLHRSHREFPESSKRGASQRHFSSGRKKLQLVEQRRALAKTPSEVNSINQRMDVHSLPENMIHNPDGSRAFGREHGVGKRLPFYVQRQRSTLPTPSSRLVPPQNHHDPLFSTTSHDSTWASDIEASSWDEPLISATSHNSTWDTEAWADRALRPATPPPPHSWHQSPSRNYYSTSNSSVSWSSTGSHPPSGWD